TCRRWNAAATCAGGRRRPASMAGASAGPSPRRGGARWPGRRGARNEDDPAPAALPCLPGLRRHRGEPPPPPHLRPAAAAAVPAPLPHLQALSPQEPEEMTMHTITLSNEEYATVLAGLRYYQQQGMGS